MQHKLKQDPGGDQRGNWQVSFQREIRNGWHFRRCEMMFNTEIADV